MTCAMRRFCHREEPFQLGKERRKKGIRSRMTLVLLKATQNGSFGKSWDMRFGKAHGGQEGMACLTGSTVHCSSLSVHFKDTFIVLWPTSGKLASSYTYGVL